jgi:hypothetical protein
MGMLDGRYEPGNRPLQQRDGGIQYVDIEIDRERKEDDVRLIIDRGMADMDEHISVP